jgi:hypothetical protein
VYEDDVAEHFAEEAKREEALDHWEPASEEPRHPRRQARDWWDRPVSRHLTTEKAIALAELNARLPGSEEDNGGRAPKRGEAPLNG